VLQIIGKQFRQPKGFLGRIISMLMKKGNRIAYDVIFEKLNIKDNENIFEIGYGHGIGIERILSKNNCFVSGIDFSELMYKEASKRNKKHIANNNARLYLGDFLTCKMDSGKYDKIFCINVTYFWDELEKPFSKIRAGLKDDGIFYFFMVHPDVLNNLKFTKDDIFNKYSIEKVVEKLKVSGFSNIDYEYKNGYYVMCKK